MALAAALVEITRERHMHSRWIQTALGNIVFFFSVKRRMHPG